MLLMDVRVQLKYHSWGFPKFRGTFWGVPIIRIIVLSILRLPYFRKLPHRLLESQGWRKHKAHRISPPPPFRTLTVGKQTLGHSESVCLAITVTEISSRSTASAFINKNNFKDSYGKGEGPKTYDESFKSHSGQGLTAHEVNTG